MPHYVCLPGYVASRHVDYGSQYIRCLVYVFSRKAHVDHVMDMLTEVSSTFLILYSTGSIITAECCFFAFLAHVNFLHAFCTPAYSTNW